MFPLNREKKCVNPDGLIENPFCIKVKSCENRMFKSKDPHNLIGHTKFAREVKVDTGTYIIDNPTDEALSYCITQPTGVLPKFIRDSQSRINIEQYDYNIPAEILNKQREIKGKPQIHKEPLPISFLQINNEIDGINWYMTHYPKIPTDLLPIIARYHWGEPITKKNIKNEKKKLKKKLVRSKHTHGPQIVTFA